MGAHVFPVGGRPGSCLIAAAPTNSVPDLLHPIPLSTFCRASHWNPVRIEALGTAGTGCVQHLVSPVEHP